MIEVWTDGLCEPINPGGTACFAYIIKRNRTKIGRDYGVIGIGLGMTNNVAEYTALIRALEQIKRMHLDKEEIIVRSDSMLVVNQMNGIWKVEAKLILPLHTKAKDLARGTNIAFKWIPREENTEADYLSRFAYSKVRNKVVRVRKEFQKNKEKYFQF